MNYDNSSLRSQMRKADRLGAKNVSILGEDELKKAKKIIKEIKDKVPEMELETFVHGAICIAHSGRCRRASSRASRPLPRSRHEILPWR